MCIVLTMRYRQLCGISVAVLIESTGMESRGGGWGGRSKRYPIQRILLTGGNCVYLLTVSDMRFNEY
jgi:hypothetical protein